jgi:hypothetical protein
MFVIGLWSLLLLASNETQDQRPRELELTFACSQS